MSLIVAVADNGVIGREGDLPWRLSRDLRRFKRLTMGHHLVLGRKSYESIGKPLPGRSMVVITRQQGYEPPGVAPQTSVEAPADAGQVTVVHSLDAALELARRAGGTEAFIGGGAQIYRLALPLADRVYRTLVHAEVDGDATFPALVAGHWTVLETERYGTDERNDHPTTFEILVRRAPLGK